jgi:general secretion pathway protein G
LSRRGRGLRCPAPPSPRASERDAEAGFSLLEIIIVLAVLAVLTAALTPFLTQYLESSIEDRSRQELQAIYRAIVGDQRTTFGYVGDVGDYPASLRDLVVSPGLPGWNGPYVNGPAFENDRLLDSYARPYEYYLATDGAGPDKLAILSGGPDRTSTNTAANANVAASFAGTAPTDGAYVTQPGNADNQGFPDPVATSALDVHVDSAFALSVQTFDSNPGVGAFVAGCPGLYDVAITSLARNATEVLPYGPGFTVDLVQGVYRVTVTARNTGAVVWNEVFTHLGTVPTARSVNVTGVDSASSAAFTLTVRNLTTVQLEIFEFSDQVGSRVDPGETRTYTVHGCAQVYARNRSTGAVVDSFVMPYANYLRVIGSGGAAPLTVTNASVKDKVDVYDNGLYIGQVKKGKTTTFPALAPGHQITFLNHKTGAPVRAPYTTMAGSNPPIVI